MSESSHINAISAIDGRYRRKVEPLAHICSELGLMKFRTQVECRWVQFLSDLPGVPELATLSAADREFIDAVATHATGGITHQTREATVMMLRPWNIM